MVGLKLEEKKKAIEESKELKSDYGRIEISKKDKYWQR